MMNRFTIDGSDSLEAALATYCEQVRDRLLDALPRRVLKAILLGGGYGRGEGGVLRTAQGDKPYNDLEFYILLSGPELITTKLFRARVHHISEELTAQAGIEVEFKLLSLRKLERSPVTMFYHDLITGHRLVLGEETWLINCDQHRAAHRIPLHEATRLLMNRCSGLLFAQNKLAEDDFTDAKADFVGRNLAKAKLAFGDVILAMRGQYHWSCRERHKRLRKLEAENALQNFESVVLLHSQGVDFKLHPVKSNRSRAELLTELAFLKELASHLWLVLESRRLGQSFGTIEAYSLSGLNKSPETSPRKNRLVNLRHFGLRGLASARYPRERLLNSLPLLLWATESLAQPAIRRMLQHELQTSADSFNQFVGVYAGLWRIYN